MTVVGVLPGFSGQALEDGTQKFWQLCPFRGFFGMSISGVNRGGHDNNTRTHSKRARAQSHEPKDSCTLGQASDPIGRVDKLIADIQGGKVKWSAEIQSKVRKQKLTLKNFPSQKYMLKPSETPIDGRSLPTEIVADGEKPSYRKSITVDSKLTEKETEKDLKNRVESIHDQMDDLYAQRTESLMVLLEGDNAAGKDGVVNHVFSISPMTTTGQVAFKGANAEERKHEPNWRIMKNLAGPGQIMFHNRSHYGDIVFATKTEQERNQRIADTRELEFGLTMGLPMTPEGHIALPDKRGNIDPSAIQRPPMRFIKVLIGVSEPEQAARFADRLEDDAKVYKITKADLEGHVNHYKVQGDFANAMAENSTPWAPAYYIPNDTKITGWRKVAQIADEILQDMDPSPPTVNKDGMTRRERERAAEKLREKADQARRD